MDKLTKFVNTCMDDIVALVIVAFGMYILAFCEPPDKVVTLLGTLLGGVVVFYFKGREAKNNGNKP